MLKKKSNAAQRAWNTNVLRLALLWARKGGVFKRRLMMDLSLVLRYLKSLLGHKNRRDSINYVGERELSFDETPIFHVKMHRPASLRFKLLRFSCINPEVDFDYDFESEDGDGEEDYGKHGVCEEIIPYEEEEEEEEGIDVRAEEFIANFYKQMKLQRQISFLQYNEMLSRSSN